MLALQVFAQARPDPAAGKKPELLWQKLEQTIRDVDHSLGGVIGVAIIDLTSRETFFYNADEIYPTASSIKISVLAELYRQDQAGSGARLSDPYVVRQQDIVPDSDIMGGLTPGVTRVTNHDLATMVVAVSDNSATNVLIDRVGMENVNAMLDSLGLHNTRLRRKMMDIQAAREGRENVSTPRELAGLMQAIYENKVVSKSTATALLDMLSTHKDSMFRRGLPDFVRAADKPGELEAVRNDTGIIYAANRPFVLSVMTTYLQREKDGEEAIARIARAAWELFDRLGRASSYGRVVSPSNSSNP
ncbi:MAG: serine hydrolase [Acidobacteria bacterium]|nr:serine hydrolase [Acidobacteriota bacterium]